MTVLTTLIDLVHIDRNALQDRFSVACVSYRGWDEAQRNELLPSLATRIYRSGPVLALVWHRSESCYWLLLPTDGAVVLDDDALSCRSDRLDGVPGWVLKALLVRALPRVIDQQAAETARFEADGLYYIVGRKRITGGSVITTVHVDIQWSKAAGQHRLKVDTHTFTPLKLHENEAGELSRRVARKTRYQPDMLGQNIARSGKGDYIRKAIWHKTKNRVPAFRLSGLVTLESYYKTRLGVLSLFQQDLQRAYGDHFRIQLQHLHPEYKRVTGKQVGQSYSRLFELLKQLSLRIINRSDSTEVGTELLAQVSRLGIEAIASDDIGQDDLNLLLVNDPNSYKDGDLDPYKEARNRYPDAVIQSCLPESLQGKGTHVVEVLLKELMIKHEIQQRRLVMDYPELPSDAWFITSVRPDDDRQKDWPMFYGSATNGTLKLAVLPLEVRELILENLSEPQRKSVFEGFARADMVFWPATGDALIVDDTQAVCLPDEPTIHQLVSELDNTARQGVPRSLVCAYRTRIASGKLSEGLDTILAAHGEKIPIAAFRSLPYRGREAMGFYDFLKEQGYRVKASMQAKDLGPLSMTSGIWIDREHAMYAAGSPDSAQRDQDNFNHIYRVESNGMEVPEWFWGSLEVWHIRHRGITVLPYLFKHVREFGQRQYRNMVFAEAQQEEHHSAH